MSRTFGLQRQEIGGPRSDVRITRALVGRVLQHFKPYRWKWALIFVCIVIGALLNAVSPLIVRAIIDHAIPDKNVRLLTILAGAIIGVAVITGFVGILQTWISMVVGQRVMFDIRNRLYQHLQRQSLGFYTVTRAGEIVSRLNNDVAAIQDTSTNTVVTIVTSIVTLIVTLFFIFSLDPKLALLAIIIVPAFYLPTRYVGKIRWKLSRETLEHQADLVSFMEERLNIGGIVLTKLFGQAETEASTFADRNREVMDLTVRQSMAGRWLFLCLSIISVLGPAAVYWYGGVHAIAGIISVGTIIAFVAYLSNLYRPVAQLADVYVSLQGALAVFQRIYEYLDRTPDVEDASEAVELTELRGHMRFENVSFEYPRVAKIIEEGEEPAPEEDRRALKDISFEVLPGQRVALVGPSGAGKTTATYMIPRFYDPTGGKITIDDHDLREITQESLRLHIGAVTQDTFLFHASIRDNLLYARPEATQEEIVAAARAANIHEFILDLADGYETVVGERGFRLSGGEKQRLAIARALLKDPKILILDEATSSLDATSEYLIQQALEKLLQGRTSVIIAHRLSTILGADKIIVLDKGRIVQSGTHAELMEQGGLYSTLYHQQFSKVMEEQRRGDV
ncbi:MAG: ABC transporter ATP-binding protein [Armatimonadota bacterium]